jgi:hypothetical protein
MGLVLVWGEVLGGEGGGGVGDDVMEVVVWVRWVGVRWRVVMVLNKVLSVRSGWVRL